MGTVMTTVDAQEAEASLSALLARVEQGEEVLIARNDIAIARLVRVERQHRREPGAWRELPGWAGFRYDPALFAPMGGKELADEGWA